MYYGFRLSAPTFTIVLLSAVVFTGCSHSASIRHSPQPNDGTALSKNDPLSLRPDDMFGRYIVSDYAAYRGSLYETEVWARDQIGHELIISPSICTFIESSVWNPLYNVKVFEPLPEGEVPDGERRLLSDFYGFGVEREAVITLDVFASASEKSKDAGWRMEIIDKDTLWYATDGWLFQLRRKGTGVPVPLAKCDHP